MTERTSKRYQIKKVVVYTLVVLGVVVAVGIVLAFLLFTPFYQGNLTAANWTVTRIALVTGMSEGIVGCGSIRSAFRVYAAGHAGAYPVLTAQNGSQLGVLGVRATDLDGQYFSSTDYEVTSGGATYTIKATANQFDDTQTYIIDQDGNESGTYTKAIAAQFDATETYITKKLGAETGTYTTGN